MFPSLSGLLAILQHYFQKYNVPKTHPPVVTPEAPAIQTPENVTIVEEQNMRVIEDFVQKLKKWKDIADVALRLLETIEVQKMTFHGGEITTFPVLHHCDLGDVVKYLRDAGINCEHDGTGFTGKIVIKATRPSAMQLVGSPGAAIRERQVTTVLGSVVVCKNAKKYLRGIVQFVDNMENLVESTSTTFKPEYRLNNHNQYDREFVKDKLQKYGFQFKEEVVPKLDLQGEPIDKKYKVHFIIRLV